MQKTKAIQTILTVLAICMIAYWFQYEKLHQGSLSHEKQTQRSTINREVQDRVKEIQFQEKNISESLWASESLAQKLEKSIEEWWDRINASTPKLKAVADIGKSTSISVNQWISHSTIPHLNIEAFDPTGEPMSFSQPKWKAFITKSITEGWILNAIEFRHVKFNPSKKNVTHHSEFFFRAGIYNTITTQRCLVSGPIQIHWHSDLLTEGDINQITKIDGTSLELMATSRPESFKLIHEESIDPPENADAIDPLLVHDIDNDGISEIVLANKNKVLRYHPDGYFSSSPLCTFHPGLISTAVFADLNSDGYADFLCHKQEGLVVIPGGPNGLFDQYEIMLRPSDNQTIYPMVLSVGDVDRDGDLDVFLGQYRIPYEGGALPTPFYNANDGHPFFLLKNSGNWQFEDISKTALPDAKRHRRIYSASLVDLDGSNGLDLVVVSDFAGVDLYLNDGTGIFKDSSENLGDFYGFGMAHAFSDFNVDGKLDLLMIGMTSPTVDRLEHSGLWRQGLTNDRSLRKRMAIGNRLFLSDELSGFKQNQLSKSIARAGWAWGCSAGDFDNNGYPDVIIGNGLETRQYVQDYEPEYWLHDAFVANSKPDPAAYLYFKDKFAQTRGKGHSYGGYESNRLFMNFEGKTFKDVGYLWGLGLQRDSRNVVTEDFNGDGRLDCLFTHFEEWPNDNQVLRVYLNQLSAPYNWIGFKVANTLNGPSATGVTIQLQTEIKQQMRTIVSGDSYRSQHSQTVHFGLGNESNVTSVIVKWPNGHQIEISNPQINQYHEILHQPN